MATVLDPYLNFRGNTREAMEFYKSVFGGELTTATFKDFGASSDATEDDLIMHAVLEGDGGIRVMAADVPDRMDYQPGTNNFSMSLSGEEETQLREYFDKLADGGSVTMPLEKAVWGDVFGMCTDRFGISWLVNVNAAKE
jgi:PhnB protein